MRYSQSYVLAQNSCGDCICILRKSQVNSKEKIAELFSDFFTEDVQGEDIELNLPLLRFLGEEIDTIEAKKKKPTHDDPGNENVLLLHLKLYGIIEPV